MIVEKIVRNLSCDVEEATYASGDGKIKRANKHREETEGGERRMKRQGGEGIRAISHG